MGNAPVQASSGSGKGPLSSSMSRKSAKTRTTAAPSPLHGFTAAETAWLQTFYLRCSTAASGGAAQHLTGDGSHFPKGAPALYQARRRAAVGACVFSPLAPAAGHQGLPGVG